MMSATINLDDQQKELCAITVMRSMLEDYSVEKGITFEEAFFQFAESKTYSTLFDYSTGLWMDGPDYLRDTFESESRL